MHEKQNCVRKGREVRWPQVKTCEREHYYGASEIETKRGTNSLKKSLFASVRILYGHVIVYFTKLNLNSDRCDQCDLWLIWPKRLKWQMWWKNKMWPYDKQWLMTKNILICHKLLMWPNRHMSLLWSEDYWPIKMWPNEELWQTHKVWPND